MLWLKSGWWIWSKTQVVIESNCGRFQVAAQNRWVTDGPPTDSGRSALGFSEPQTVRVRWCRQSASVRFFRLGAVCHVSMWIDSSAWIIVSYGSFLILQATSEDSKGHHFQNQESKCIKEAQGQWWLRWCGLWSQSHWVGCSFFSWQCWRWFFGWGYWGWWGWHHWSDGTRSS